MEEAAPRPASAAPAEFELLLVVVSLVIFFLLTQAIERYPGLFPAPRGHHASLGTVPQAE